MIENKKELMEYIKLLRDLLLEDFRCEVELNQALKLLHSLMLAKKENVFIIVLEKDHKGLEKSTEMFRSILTSAIQEKRTIKESILKTENVLVRIFIIKDENDLNKLRGFQPNYVINNTDDKDLPSNLGIKYTRDI